MAEQQPGYSERDDEPTTEQTGGDPEDLRRAEREPGEAASQADGEEGEPHAPTD